VLNREVVADAAFHIYLVDIEGTGRAGERDWQSRAYVLGGRVVAATVRSSSNVAPEVA
jgi:hypothetical protein